MLTHLAERMNAANAIAILSQSLSEERSMAELIYYYAFQHCTQWRKRYANFGSADFLAKTNRDKSS
jgi:ferritin-like metal-binding protein YciE